MKRTIPRRGLTLPLTLILLAAIFTLLVGLLTWSQLRSRLAQLDSATAQSNLALNRAQSLLETRVSPLLLTDQFWVLEGKPREKSAPPLWFATYNRDKKEFAFTPLVSFPDSAAFRSGKFLAPEHPSSLAISTRILPDLEMPADFPWINSRDDQGKLVARYAYVCLDLEGRINLAALEHESHSASDEQLPTSPGISEQTPHSREFHLAALVPEPLSLAEIHPSTPLQGTPDLARLILYPSNFQRDAYHRFIAPSPRALQLHTTYLAQPYHEQLLIPPLPDFAENLVGTSAKNLNSFLTTPHQETDLAAWIQLALPEFSKRAGGFPEDYLATLSANALDYADTDSTPRSERGHYRGIDSFPLVSEWILQVRWHANPIIRGVQHIQLRIRYFAEFHNLTTRACSLSGKISLESKFQVVVNEKVIGSINATNPNAISTPALQIDGDQAFAPIDDFSLAASEFLVRKIAEISLDFPVSSLPKSIELRGDDAKSSYELHWNGELAEAPRGKIRRSNVTLTFASDSKTNPRQKHRACLPGLSYLRGSTQYIDNPGDLRASHTLAAPLAPNDYPDNFSPQRRNVRYANLYALDSPEKPRVRYRCLPSEWPDGGHNAPFSPIPPALLAALGNKDGDERISPDAPEWGKPEAQPNAAIQTISNRGYFLSPTELGHVFDPAQWSRTPPISTAPAWGEIYASSEASTDIGGGNTLRIGRPEHPRFDQSGTRATALLDLFFAGNPQQPNDTTRKIFGQINLNTATLPALRAALSGKILSDPLLAQRISPIHDADSLAPPTTQLALEPPSDLIARAIIAARPFLSPSQLALLRDETGEPIFGNRALFRESDAIEWNDRACEEVFARAFNTASIHSRHLRVYLIAQAIQESDHHTIEVLHEVRKQIDYRLTPPTRHPDGSIAPEPPKLTRLISREW